MNPHSILLGGEKRKREESEENKKVFIEL